MINRIKCVSRSSLSLVAASRLSLSFAIYLMSAITREFMMELAGDKVSPLFGYNLRKVHSLALALTIYLMPPPATVTIISPSPPLDTLFFIRSLSTCIFQVLRCCWSFLFFTLAVRSSSFLDYKYPTWNVY